MKPVKHFLSLLFAVFALTTSAQETQCDEFLSLFEAGEYDKVVTLLNDCKKADNLNQKTIDEYDFYLQISYGYLEDFDNFDAERLEKLTEDYVFRSNKNIVDAFVFLSHYYANNSNYDKATELIETTLFFAKQHISFESEYYAVVLSILADIHFSLGDYSKAIEYMV